MEHGVVVVRAKGGEFVSVIAEADKDGGVNILISCNTTDIITPMFVAVINVEFKEGAEMPTMKVTPIVE